jgi:D-threo-aldose 1-dehydrogenase
VVEAGWDGGIRYFDTAPLYGHGLSERRLGSRLGALPREGFVLSSKVGRLLVPAAEGVRDPQARDREPFAVRYDYSYDGARRSLESSLERLGLDRIDILLCHDIDVWTHGDEQPEIYRAAERGILPALSDLRSEGVIRAFGLGVNEAAVCLRVLGEFDVDCFLLAGRFTLLEQSPLDDLPPRCVREQVSVIIGGPYNSGLLAQTDRRRATYDYKPVDDVRWERAQRIREICSARGVDARAAALQYPLRHPAVASVIPGVWRLEEVETNLSLFQTEIPDALWDDLADAGLARKI